MQKVGVPKEPGAYRFIANAIEKRPDMRGDIAALEGNSGGRSEPTDSVGGVQPDQRLLEVEQLIGRRDPASTL